MDKERNCCCFIATLHADIHEETNTALLTSVATGQLKTLKKTVLGRQKQWVQREKGLKYAP